MAESNSYDLMIVDLMLPHLDGLSLVRRVRSSGSAVPILVLTACDEKESVVALLNAGADDYVTKPFYLGELIARAKALILRGKGKSDTVIRFQDIEIDVANKAVTRGGSPVVLTAMEYRVLEYLAHRQGPSSPSLSCLSIFMTSVGRSSAT